jgi:sodium-dependent phosphate transporter
MYQWFVVVGSLFAFTYGFGTGSNDVANAFGTSVGAKTLTMRQAVLIAFVFEFVGAIVLGRVSTNTIAGGVADIKQFAKHPDVYAYGMMVSLGVAGFLQIFASYLELNISATHSIIGDRKSVV